MAVLTKCVHDLGSDAPGTTDDDDFHFIPPMQMRALDVPFGVARSGGALDRFPGDQVARGKGQRRVGDERVGERLLFGRSRERARLLRIHGLGQRGQPSPRTWWPHLLNLSG